MLGCQQRHPQRGLLQLLVRSGVGMILTKIGPGKANKQEKLGSEKKKKETRKHSFHGNVPGFGGEFCLCVFFSPIRNDLKKTHKHNFATRPILGQSHKLVYVFVFFFSLKNRKNFTG